MAPLLARLLACSLAVLASCGAPQTPKTELPKAQPGRVKVPGLPISVELPADLGQLDAQTWVLPVGRGQNLVLHVDSARLEEGQSLDGYVDRLIAEVNRTGDAGVEQDTRVELGDLEGRLVQAVELRGESPKALWLVAVEAEHGVYTGSVLGPATEVRERRKVLEGFLKSLRVTTPAAGIGATRPTDAPPNDLPPTEESP